MSASQPSGSRRSTSLWRTSSSKLSRRPTTGVSLGLTPNAEPLKFSGVDGTKPEKASAEVPATLKGIDASFPTGQLTMIVGPVGCGKSSVIAALLGEMKELGAARFGEIELPPRVAYAAQTPFISSDTLRANVLFGQSMDDDWYNTVLEACALTSDLKILAGGDMTQIGEKGVNLSGGQKARVSLARAVYARPELLLLDDPLSAVDAHVGKHLFTHALGVGGVAAASTRILVTHQTQFLPLADHILVMEEGAVVASGSYDELRTRASHLSVLSSLSVGEATDPKDADADENSGGPLPSSTPSTPGAAATPSNKAALTKKTGLSSLRSEVNIGNLKATNKGAKLVELEERQTGQVPRKVFLDYIAAAGGLGFLAILLVLLFLDRGLTTFTDVWLAEWIESDESDNLKFYVPIYVGAALLASVAVYCRSIFFMVVMGMRAAKAMHAKLLGVVLAAPMVFFETTPSGRILNRFTTDTEFVDNIVLQNLQQWFNCIFPVLSTVVLVSLSLYWSLLWLIPVMGLYVLLYRHTVSATRDVQRLEAVSRSPIFSQFSETLGGISTIRAFGASTRFQAASERLINQNTRCNTAQYLLTSYSTLILETLAASTVGVAALLPTLSFEFGNEVNVALAGVALASTLEMSQYLKHGTRMTLEVQKAFAGIERIVEYIDNVPIEAVGGRPPPQGKWPSSGEIAVTDLCVRYRPELPYALRHVSCTIPPKSKVGIVGRTGSGKSTFLTALWRLVEAEGGADGTGAGAVCIDGVDTANLQLSGLRSRLAIIPQDPVLFNDSVRYNLDPFGEHSDADISRVLGVVQLAQLVGTFEAGLSHKVTEGGQNFSVGQRQLLCLARATLRHSLVLALDEATASIDNETDAVLQQAIREMFADCTVLTIAHRLHTIMDSTAVMLFEAGELAEFDDPEVLLSDPESLFSRLVDETGSAAAHLRDLSRRSAALRTTEPH